MRYQNSLRKPGWMLLVSTLLVLTISILMLQGDTGVAKAEVATPTYPAWWKEVQTSNKKTLNALWGDSTQGFFAVGDAGLILHTTRAPNDPLFDNSWQVMTSNTTEPLLAIWGTDSSHLFAGGINGTILFYNGSMWTKMDVQPIYHIYDLWGASNNDVYAVGLMRDMSIPQSTMVGVVLHYDGQSWRVARSGSSGSRFFDIWGSSADDIFVTSVSYSTAGTTHAIWHYDGAQWTSTTLDGLSVYQTFQDIWGSAADDVFVVVGCTASIAVLPCVERGQPLIYHFDGQSWSPMQGVTEHFLSYSLTIQGALPSYEVPFGLWGDSSQNLFLVGSRGLILHYNGSTWQALPNGYGDTTLYAISGDSQGLVAVGQDGIILSYADTHLSCADVTQISRAECEVLVDFYLSTNARINLDRTARWLQNIYPCGASPTAINDPYRWQVVFCHEGRVHWLGPSFARGERLWRPSGTLPLSLAQLTELRELWMENAVTGTIPEWLGQLTQLTKLHLRSNVFHGQLPASLGNLAELTELNLLSASSDLRGPLPAELGQLGKLKLLNVRSNQKLNGPLPTTLAQLTQLEKFDFFGTSLCIPDDAALQSWLANISAVGADILCASTHTVRGVARDQRGNPLAGVEVAAQMDGAPGWYGAGVSGVDGSYAIPYLRTGSYTLRPSRDDTVFTPITRTVNLAAEVTGQDFVGVASLVRFKTGTLTGQSIQPDSKLIIEMVDYPPNGQGRILINGRHLGTLMMDNNGQAAFLLDTSGATHGDYMVTVEVNPAATLQLRLAAAGVLVEESDDALPQVQIPPGIALHLAYLPVITR